jgi:lipopolysaccharide biosynthesis glycosyltransferase
MSASSHDASGDEKDFHIAFGVDEKYFRGMGVAITSILENNPRIHFIFHVFCFSISSMERERLSLINVGQNSRVIIHVVDPSVFDGFGHIDDSFHFSAKSALIRLVIPSVLHRVAKNVLYLDSDIICSGDMSMLASIALDGAIVAVVKDMGDDPLLDMQCYLFNIDRRKYFNAGFIYIDVNEWMANNITAMAIDIILKHNEDIVYPDQDALNVVLKGKTKILDNSWNFQLSSESLSMLGDTEFTPCPKVAFTHFVGRLKPWHNWNIHAARFLYLHYEARSPWHGMPLEGPKNIDEAYAFSRILFRHWNIIGGVSWRFKHWMMKLTGSHPKVSRTRWKKIVRKMRLFHKNRLQRVGIEGHGDPGS